VARNWKLHRLALSPVIAAARFLESNFIPPFSKNIPGLSRGITALLSGFR
jgi:hypothetical protein